MSRFPDNFLAEVANEYDLSTMQKEVFLLRIGDNMSYEDIANRLGTSVDSCFKCMSEVYRQAQIKGLGRGKEQKLRSVLTTRYNEYEQELSTAQAVNANLDKPKAKAFDLQGFSTEQLTSNQIALASVRFSTDPVEWLEKLYNRVELEDDVELMFEEFQMRLHSAVEYVAARSYRNKKDIFLEIIENMKTTFAENSVSQGFPSSDKLRLRLKSSNQKHLADSSNENRDLEKYHKVNLSEFDNSLPSSGTIKLNGKRCEYTMIHNSKDSVYS